MADVTPSSCCSTAAQETCCEPDAKDTCCGTTAVTGSCGCSEGQADVGERIRAAEPA